MDQKEKEKAAASERGVYAPRQKYKGEAGAPRRGRGLGAGGWGQEPNWRGTEEPADQPGCVCH